MRWELTDEQQSLRASFRGWLDANAATPTVREWFDRADATEFTDRLARDGWLDIGLAEDSGGQGGGLVELCLLAEELGGHIAPSSLWLGVVLARAALGAEYSALDATAAASGCTVLAIPGESLPREELTVEVAEGDRLTGQVSTVLGAETASTLIVPAVRNGSAGLYAVDARSAGVARTVRPFLDRSRTAADVALTDVTATRIDVDVATAYARVRSTAAVILAADSVGTMQSMLDTTVAYTKERQQFGVPVASFQAVKHSAATMLVAVEAARSIAYYAAATVEQSHSDSALHAAAAKAQATQEGAVAADTALTLHGAVGYTWEHNLHLSYKRAKLNQYLYGSTETWNAALAAALTTT